MKEHYSGAQALCVLCDSGREKHYWALASALAQSVSAARGCLNAVKRNTGTSVCFSQAQEAL